MLLSTLVPKWSDPNTPPPKVTLPSGASAPRLGGAQKPLSPGFFSNLRDFLAERPVKIPKNGKGAIFTPEGFGSSLTENLKEWFKPAPREIRGAAASRMTVEWQPFYKVFFQNIRDLISPPKLPPLKVTSQPVKVKDIWSKDKAFGPSQAIALAVHIGHHACSFCFRFIMRSRRRPKLPLPTTNSSRRLISLTTQ